LTEDLLPDFAVGWTGPPADAGRAAIIRKVSFGRRVAPSPLAA